MAGRQGTLNASNLFLPVLKLRESLNSNRFFGDESTCTTGSFGYVVTG